MAMTTSTVVPIAPADVHATLARYILADGFDLVFDFEKSHGSWLHDARNGREYLDFLHLLRVEPHRLQPPEDEGPGVPRAPCTGWRS